MPAYGKVTVDVSYGGQFYAYMPVEQLGLDLFSTPTDKLRQAAGLVTGNLNNMRAK